MTAGPASHLGTGVSPADARPPAPDPFRLDSTIPERFSEIVAMDPERRAVRSPERCLTRGELDRWSNRVGRQLAEDGRRGPVAVLCDREIETVVGVLGAIKAGRPALFASTSEPVPRLAAMLDTASADALVVTRSVPEPALAVGRTVVDVEVPGDDGRLEVVVHPDDPAVIKFTSGSMGAPKGVVHSQRAVLAMVSAFVDALDVSPDERLITLNRQLTLDVFTGLLTPAQLLLFDVARRGVAPFDDWMRAERATMFRTTPTLLRRLTAAAGPTAPDLHTVAVAGETLPPTDVARARAALGRGVRLIHFYGTGETGVTTSYVVEGPVDPTAPVPVGRTVRGSTFELVDAGGAPVPAGEVGTIEIGGESLALGYVGAPELTDERFRGRGPDRRFHTGDLGRIDDAGNLIFLGRDDGQLKIAGNRVEPAEVEAAMRHVPGVDEAAVAGREVDGETALVGYYCGPADLSPTDLHRALRPTLPNHMIPTAWMRLASIPTDVHGKTARSALPDLPPPRPTAAAALGGTEARMAALWETVLGVDGIRPDDAFFALGGDSLSAIALAAAAEDEFGRHLPAGELFADDSLRAMSAVVDGSPELDPGPRLVPLARSGDRPPIFVPHLPGWKGFGGTRIARIGGGHPVLAVVDSGAPDRPPDADLTAIADRYADAITAAAAPPYHLLGSSAGGVLAYELGRRLAHRGHEVAFVGMLDTAFPHPLLAATWAPWRALRQPARWGRRARLLFARPRHRRAGSSGTSPAAAEADRLLRLRRSLIAYRRYRVAAPGGPVTLFRAARGGRRSRRSAARWAPWIDEIVDVPGAHDGPDGILADQHLDTLLAAVRSAVRRAGERSGSRSRDPVAR